MNQLDTLLCAAEEFASNLWEIKDHLSVRDIMLFGSLARKEPNPRDVDLLIIHQNPMLDVFKFSIADRKDIPGYLKYHILLTSLNGTGNLLREKISGSAAETLIKEDLLNVNYMNLSFFNNQTYRELWRKMCCTKNPQFDLEIFRYGMLWNQETKRFGLSARRKYQIPN